MYIHHAAAESNTMKYNETQHHSRVAVKAVTD